jgi:hypothetical protein
MHQSLPQSRFQQLDSFDAVVEALGGKAATGELCDGQNTAAVCNWKRRRERFPAKYYPEMIDELNARGFDAPMTLWGFYWKSKKR